MTGNEWANEDWNLSQEYERKWWGDACNTFAEETKHLTYAYKMGLTCFTGAGMWPCYDLNGTRVLDIGGGPTSILLKCQRRGPSRVADPCNYPLWVKYRYYEAGIEFSPIKGEDLSWGREWDEVWCYNVLQHTEDPELIIMNARRMAPVIRLFEWIDIPPHQGHPQELKEESLNKWLGGEGRTEQLNENGCNARAYYGVFPTDAR